MQPKRRLVRIQRFYYSALRLLIVRIPLLPWHFRKFLLLLMLVVATILVSRYWQAGNVLQIELEKIVAAGMPTTLSQLEEYAGLPPGVIDVTDDLVAILDQIDQVRREFNAKDLKRFAIHRRTVAIGMDGSFERLPTLPYLAGEGIETYEDYLSRFEKPIRELEELLKSDGAIRFESNAFQWNHRVIHSRLANVQMILRPRAFASAFRGDVDAAARSIHTSFRLANTLRFDPDPSALLTRFDIIQQSWSNLLSLMDAVSLPDAKLQSFQEILLDTDYNEALLRMQVARRAIALSGLEHSKDDREPWYAWYVRNGRSLLGTMLFPHEDRLALLKISQATIDLADDPSGTNEKRLRKTANTISNSYAYRWTSTNEHLQEYLDGGSIYSAWYHIDDTVITVALAVERYRQVNGVWPEDIAVLSPRFLNKHTFVDGLPRYKREFNYVQIGNWSSNGWGWRGPKKTGRESRKGTRQFFPEAGCSFEMPASEVHCQSQRSAFGSSIRHYRACLIRNGRFRLSWTDLSNLSIEQWGAKAIMRLIATNSFKEVSFQGLDALEFTSEAVTLTYRDIPSMSQFGLTEADRDNVDYYENRELVFLSGNRVFKISVEFENHFDNGGFVRKTNDWIRDSLLFYTEASSQ